MWSVGDARKATASLDRLCRRLVARTPAPGDVIEWARLTTGMPVDGDGPIDCNALIADYDAFWRTLAQKPRAAAAVAGARWPPSLADVAALSDAIDIPGGGIDVGTEIPAVDLPALLQRRLCRRGLLEARGPGTVDPAFPHPLPRWKEALAAGSGGTDGRSQGERAGGPRHAHPCGATASPQRGARPCVAYAVVVVPPPTTPDEEGEYDAAGYLYGVNADGSATEIAMGIVEWGADGDATHVARGDVDDRDQAAAAVGRSAHLLPEFLARLADDREFAVDGDDNRRNPDTKGTVTTPCEQHAAPGSDFDCAPGSVSGVDEVRGGLVEVGSPAGLPEAVLAFDPDIDTPVLMTWLDAAQLRLAVDLFAGQRAAKTARAMADADVLRSLEGSAASVYRGPAFEGLLPESVADRLAFHRWVRGCAGARDRPQYEFARAFWEGLFLGDLDIRLDADPEVDVDRRRTACGQDAAADVLAAAASLGDGGKDLDAAGGSGDTRLLCTSLAPEAIRAGAWAVFGVHPLDPASLDPRASLAALTTQRRAWRRACAGTAEPAEVAQLVATAEALGLPLDDEDLASPGRLCGRLALLMAL